MAKKYEELAERVVEELGGKDNITYFTHCVTRLRFNVKDKGRVKKDSIDSIPGVLGSQWQGEQYQIIIGQSVEDAYNLVIEKTGLKREDAINENIDEGSDKKKFSVGALFDVFAGCMTPLIPLLIGGGLVKVLVVLLTTMGVLSTDSSTYTVLSWVGDAAFYYLPVFIGCSGAKKFGANVGIGMLLGAILIHPTFLGLVGEGAKITVFGLPVYAGSYTSSVFPMILTMYACAKVQKIIGKYSPDVIRSITEPLLTILIMTPIMLCILAPIGSWIGTYLAVAIMFVYNKVGFIAFGILAACFPYIVATGMHTAFTPYLLQAMTSPGFDGIICPANFISNFNQGAACAAIALKTKKKNLKATATTCAVTAIVGGVTEPAMFGVTLKEKKANYGAIIGGLVGGLVGGLFHIAVYTFPGNGGLFGTIAFLGPTMDTLVKTAIAIVVGVVVTFISTLIIYKDSDKKEVA